MSPIAFVTWNGDGNLAPALSIARELHRRGHRAALLGEDAQRPAVEAAGLVFTGYPAAFSVGRPASHGGGTPAPADFRYLAEHESGRRPGGDAGL
jgi:hypothetical protein